MNKTETNPAENWQSVLVVMDYYDAPLIGVANFEGVPHAFVVDDEIVRPATPEEQETWGQDSVRELVYRSFQLLSSPSFMAGMKAALLAQLSENKLI